MRLDEVLHRSHHVVVTRSSSVHALKYGRHIPEYSCVTERCGGKVAQSDYMHWIGENNAQQNICKLGQITTNFRNWEREKIDLPILNACLEAKEIKN